MQKIIAIIGARPQFIKHAPIELALKEKVELVSIHTGQHYDNNMSQIFFDQLKMTKPKYMLSVGSHSHGVQTGKMMIEIEPIIQKEAPNAVLVYGDTNSTLAGALVAAKLHIPLIHIEAGLRSFNKEMPEEVNRILTDHVSSILFAPTQLAINNLKNEGIQENVFLTGDVMCDMVEIAKSKIESPEKDQERFYYATIHRPYNTDIDERLKRILEVFNSLDAKVKFAVHPRTRNKIRSIGLAEKDFPNIEFMPPVSYFQNISFQRDCLALISDSGGMQKEAYILKKRCITIRKETEWVETLEGNWNTLVYEELETIKDILKAPLGVYKKEIYGNGQASHDISSKIINFLNS